MGIIKKKVVSSKKYVTSFKASRKVLDKLEKYSTLLDRSKTDIILTALKRYFKVLKKKVDLDSV